MNPPFTTEDLVADLVIVGSGAAGLSAALAAAAPRISSDPAGVVDGRDLRILVLTRGAFGTDGASPMAQGGIAAAMSPLDSPALHALDTTRAGAGLVDAERAGILAAEGPERVRELIRMGALFDRAPDGSLALGLEGAHSRRRIVHASGDRTGWEVTRVLAEGVLGTPGIRILEGTEALELLTTEADGDDYGDAGARWGEGTARLRGVRVRDANGAVRDLLAPIVLLATGGAAHLYRYCTSPASAIGDGIAMAATIGARLDGMEFVQFHPTALRVDADPLPLVTEALRGEGAVLVDGMGRPVMEGAGAGKGALASRDEVARILWMRMESGDDVFLDARDAIGDAFPTRFPEVYRHCVEHGVDPVREPVPVTPAAHYVMGGIAVDADGRSSIPGLRAAGEVASTGVHGANRLASNSLLEGLVYGRRAGRAARRDLGGELGAVASSIAALSEAASVDILAASTHAEPVPDYSAIVASATVSSAAGPSTTAASPDLLLRLRTLMWERVGVVRSGEGLRDALATMDDIEREAVASSAVTAGTTTPVVAAASAGSGSPAVTSLDRPLTVARAIARAALAREETRGSHARSDFPERADARASDRYRQAS